MPADTAVAPVHVEHTGGFVLPLPLREAFPLFTPEGEETPWLVLEHDPAAGIAAHGRFTPGSRLGTVRVRCVAEGERQARVTVTCALTATSAHGNEALEGFDAAVLAAKFEGWREAILALRPAATAPWGGASGLHGARSLL